MSWLAVYYWYFVSEYSISFCVPYELATEPEKPPTMHPIIAPTGPPQAIPRAAPTYAPHAPPAADKTLTARVLPAFTQNCLVLIY